MNILPSYTLRHTTRSNPSLCPSRILNGDWPLSGLKPLTVGKGGNGTVTTAGQPPNMKLFSSVTLRLALSMLLLGISLHPCIGQKNTKKQTTTAQEADCNSIYRKALVAYEQGYIDKTIELLQGCTDAEAKLEGLDRLDKANIYWLLAQAHTLRKQLTEATQAYRTMLTHRPQFKPKDNDLEDLRLIYKSLVVEPKWAVYFVGGPSQSFENLRRKHEILTSNSAQIQKSYRRPEINYQLGLGSFYKLYKHLQIHVEVNLWSQSIAYKQNISQTFTQDDIVTIVDPATQQDIQLDTLGTSEYSLNIENTHRQQLSYLSVPIFIRPTLPLSRNIQLYAEMGGYASLLLSAIHTTDSKETNSFTNVRTANNSLTSYSISNHTVDTKEVKSIFIPHSSGYILGAGLKALIKNKWYVSLGIRYQHAIVNTTNQDNRYFNNPLLPYYDVADDFSINTFTVLGSIAFPLQYQTHTIKRQNNR